MERAHDARLLRPRPAHRRRIAHRSVQIQSTKLNQHVQYVVYAQEREKDQPLLYCQPPSVVFKRPPLVKVARFIPSARHP